MRFFVRRADTSDILEIEAVTASEAAFAYCRRYTLTDGARVIVEGDGTRNFLMTCGTLSEEGEAAGNTPPTSGKPVPAHDPAQIETRVVQRLAAEFADRGYWIRMLAILMMIGSACAALSTLIFLFIHNKGVEDDIPIFISATFMLVIAVVYAWFSILLFRTERKAREAAETGSEAALACSMKSIGILLKVGAIAILSTFSFYVLFLMVLFVVALAR